MSERSGPDGPERTATRAGHGSPSVPAIDPCQDVIVGVLLRGA